MSWRSSRPRPSRSYNTPEHKAARAALLARFRPGDPCCLCGRPMWPPTRDLDADHRPGSTEYRGLAHGACNRSDGARRARAKQSQGVTTLRW